MTLLVSGFGLYRAWFPASRAAPTERRHVVSSDVAADNLKTKHEVPAMKHEASEPTSGLTKEGKPDGPVVAPAATHPQ